MVRGNLLYSCVRLIISSNPLHRSDVQKTCPICRNALEASKTEYWEVPETPSRVEIGQFVMGLAEGAGAPPSP